MTRTPAEVYRSLSSGPVVVSREGALATITLNDPDRRNALTGVMKEALREAVATVGGDEDVRAVVLAANGPAFCVGQDLAEHAAALEAGAEQAFATVEAHYAPIVVDLLTMPKPVVAAVQGACVGAGLGLALACDLRVWSSSAKVGTAFSGIGLTFDTGLSLTLPGTVGQARTKELMFTGRVLRAEEAVAWGMGGEVVPVEDVGRHASALGAALASGPTVAFAETKRLLADDGALSAALRSEARAQTCAGDSADHRAAVAAFLAKKAPAFVGR